MNDWIDNGTYYAFAAKGIQSYILRSDRLKEMIGASEIVEQLPRELFATALDECKLQVDADYTILSQTAGSARLVFKDGHDVRTLFRIWPLLVGQFAPGLAVTQAMNDVNGNLAQAMDHAEDKMRAARNRLVATLPPAGPLSRRNPSNGEPALAFQKNRRGKQEAVDLETIRKQAMAKDANSHLINRIAGKGGGGNAEQWAFEFDDIAGENSYLAVIHADANGLGSLGRTIRESAGSNNAEMAGRLKRFSDAVETANIAAARKAVAAALNRLAGKKEPLNKRNPLRPIICAGDDLTVVIRADLAMCFVQSYLEAFEDESQRTLQALGIEGVNGLTACAGVAFAKRGYPYWRAYELAESLCRHAKTGVARQASAVSFWRVTTSLGTDFDEVIKNELTRANCVLTMAPYVVGKHIVGRPTLAHLLNLLEAIHTSTPRGSLRHVISSAYISKDQADRDFERARDVASKCARGELDEALTNLTGGSGAGSLWENIGSSHATPLLDAIELKAVGTSNAEVEE